MSEKKTQVGKFVVVADVIERMNIDSITVNALDEEGWVASAMETSDAGRTGFRVRSFDPHRKQAIVQALVKLEKRQEDYKELHRRLWPHTREKE